MNPKRLAPGFDAAARRMIRLRCVVDAGVTLLQYSASLQGIGGKRCGSAMFIESKSSCRIPWVEFR